ncbi:helicase-related protein [Bordetella hinzii]|uniref:helicase-related protein n=1 Tax=Bordetella hinzii TaxID=103855 RepID=UPI001150BD30|nr:helicase-related protein [Bordetella hinzii]QDJ31593.1 hypothetical protein CBR68_04340 [Bordetella hinzii]
MKQEDFDRVINHWAQWPEFQADWTRQRDTARALLRRFADGYDTQLLGDEVGMGKTYVAMAMMGAMLHGRGSKHRRALLITPSSAVLRSKWEQELRGFSDAYLDGGRKKATQLRPLVISDYWQLVANLHHYDVDPVERVTESLGGSIVEAFRSWCVRNALLTTKVRFKLDVPYDPGSVETLRFESRFSRAGWWAFLDELKAGHEAEILENLTRLRAGAGEALRGFFWLKGKFREFSAVQRTFAPNVLIVGMSGLRPPRYDSGENLQFCAFAIGVLLAGRHADTRKALISSLKRGNVLPWTATSESLKALERADLYHMRASISTAMDEDDQLRSEWNSVQRTLDPNAGKAFLKRLAFAAVRSKLRESGICLAIIDEAHNWKGGNNGATTFRDVFAAGIPHKLLMSATPFQLEEGELRSVFGYAATAGGQSMAVLDDLFATTASDSVVSRCLKQNEIFGQAWEALSGHAGAIAVLNERMRGTTGGGVTEIMRALSEAPYLDPSLTVFCKAALDYRDAVDQLVARQRLVMIRHTKRRDYRAFHSGVDFPKDDVYPQRTSLYQVEGMAEPGDVFLHYMAMRMDQQIRADGKQANAHLMSGLTSSVSAYQASARRRKAIPRNADAITLQYVAMFGSAVENSKHPKVRATVSRAIDNYRNGRKTLIFCERVDTLAEIQAEIFKALDHDFAPGQMAAQLVQRRKDFLERADVVDMRLARLLWLAKLSDKGMAQRLRAMQADASHYAAGVLARTGVNVTARRVMRLMDIWAIAHLQRASGVSVPDAVHRQFQSIFQRTQGSQGPNSEVNPIWQAVLAATPAMPVDLEEVASEVRKYAELWFSDQPNIWEDADFAVLVLELLGSEADILNRMSDSDGTAYAFYDTYMALQRGLRKVILRPDLFRSYLWQGETAHAASLPSMSELPTLVHEGIRKARGHGESPWRRTYLFMQALLKASGSMNPHASANTKRRSLWRGANIQAMQRGVSGEEVETVMSDDDLAVQVLSGNISADRRISICAAFNSPLAPDILVCTSIGSEGIDLHRECAEVVHHDLPWNPAKLEQRIGRIDRVGSLAEVNGQRVRVGLPFQQHTYERWQHDVLLGRAQRFQVLLGKPDFDPAEIEEEDPGSDDGRVIERSDEPDDSASGATVAPALPDTLLNWLSVDLSLECWRV